MFLYKDTLHHTVYYGGKLETTCMSRKMNKTVKYVRHQ